MMAPQQHQATPTPQLGSYRPSTSGGGARPAAAAVAAVSSGLQDAAAAVAGLQRAADDVEALERAIAVASWLDAVPGEARQKLRAARSKWRKLQAAQVEQARAAAANTEKSPWARAEYEAAEFDHLVAHYESLNWRMIQKPGGASVKPEPFYQLYALHMQAANGDNTAERPMWAEKGGLDFEGRARWDAWTAVKGKPADAAKLAFVQLFCEFPASVLYKDNRGTALPAQTAPA